MLTNFRANTRRDFAVTLCVGSGSYTDGLVEELYAKEILTRAIRVAPKLEVWEGRNGLLLKIAAFPAANFLQRAIWAAWRRMPFRRRMQLPILITARFTDHMVSRRIQPANVFHGITGNAFRSLQKARPAGIVTVIEHPMVHPRRWQSEVLEECRRFGVNPRDCDTVLPEPLIRRREQEFALADKIVVLSRFALSTFEAAGPKNAETILPGVDAELFRPDEARRMADPFRICYVGRLEMGKGVLYLLKAWKQLKLKNAELLLMGEVRPEVARRLTEYVDESVRIAGFVPRIVMAQELRQSSVFAFPSLHEGFGLVLLEAMASGVPVIATRSSGAPDCVTEGEDGFIVQPRSVDEIAGRIEWCYRNREALEWMGQNARRKVETNFTLQCYRARLVAFYERLVFGESPATTD